VTTVFHRTQFRTADGAAVRCSWFQFGSLILGYRQKEV